MFSVPIVGALTRIVTEGPSAPVKEIDPDKVSPGFLGLIIFLALALATFLLWRSMNHQLDRIDFDDAGETPPRPGDAGEPSGQGDQVIDLADKATGSS